MDWIANKKINHDYISNKLKSTCESTNQYTNYGSIVKELEDFVKDKFKIDNSKAVICCNNGTSALYALTSGINVFHAPIHGKQIQWVTQSLTFPVSAQGMLKDAIIIDIDKNGGIDLELVPENVNGLIVTNCFGNVVDIDKYINWCKKRNIFLVFDNAGTAYSFYKGKNSCNYGNGSIISFHHTKPFGFGEGGAIIVDKQYEYIIRKLMNFGIDNSDSAKYELYWNRLGNNYKMSEIAAVYILSYLKDNFDTIIKHHINIYEHFRSLEQNNKLTLYPNFADENMTVPMCITLLDKSYTNEHVNLLIDNGIYCRKYYCPLILTEISEYMYKHILCLPCNIDIDLNLYLTHYNIITTYL